MYPCHSINLILWQELYNNANYVINGKNKREIKNGKKLTRFFLCILHSIKHNHNCYKLTAFHFCQQNQDFIETSINKNSFVKVTNFKRSKSKQTPSISYTLYISCLRLRLIKTYETNIRGNAHCNTYMRCSWYKVVSLHLVRVLVYSDQPNVSFVRDKCLFI